MKQTHFNSLFKEFKLCKNIYSNKISFSSDWSNPALVTGNEMMSKRLGVEVHPFYNDRPENTVHGSFRYELNEPLYNSRCI